MGIMAFIFAISLSAFSKKEALKPIDEKWFELKPGGNPLVASDYTLYGDGNIEPTCTGSHVCAKLARPDSQNPNIPDLMTEIATRYRTTP